jgi:deazaflavin-dependent oxidoreductase (nitroreductase family)
MPPPRWVMRLQWRAHRLVYGLSRGRLGTKVIGMPVLELTTTGRRSGEPRSVLLTHLEHPEGFVVVASNAGADRHPAWWLNLKAHPEATVRRGRAETSVVARRLEGEQRDREWNRITAVNPGYLEYAGSTARDIPVVLLQRC